MHVMLAIVLVLSNVILLANGRSLLDWHQFKNDYKKHYATVAEETQRKEIFFENVNRMHVYQQMHPNATFKLAINHLTDQRIEELLSHRKLQIFVPPTTLEHSIKCKDLPDSLDWRTKDVITPVKTPGWSDTDYGAAAVELVESLHAIQTKALEIGSVARLVDCCNQPDALFQCISNLSGICREDEYPRPTWLCHPHQCQPFANFDTMKVLEIPNEDTMVTWIQDSPLFVGFDGNTTSFQSYSSGIYQDATCSTTNINLSMQLVGYGKTDSGELYWLCRNSWGRGWGEKGYIRVLRGKNMCGIATQVIQIA